jgi:[FeFe] hydrogenase H-cluster maturation GTPase HydF
MQSTPLAERIKIVLYGLRNSGKSSLMNNIFGKEVAIVSKEPGTTTDPVTRTIELSGLGPSAITDTAGIDDTGELGALRIGKTKNRAQNADIILFVTRIDLPPSDIEKEFISGLDPKSNLLIAMTFADRQANSDKLDLVKDLRSVLIDNNSVKGIMELKEALISFKYRIEHEMTMLEGLVEKNDLVLLVTPIDKAAPKGRLILPQVEVIRDLLDKECASLVVTEKELEHFYYQLKERPKLVVTDSQVFGHVAKILPEDQLLTSFSILLARKKGDLAFFIEGIKELKNVPPGSKILIMEYCSHHRQDDDIGTVKIPRLFREKLRADVVFDFRHELPSVEELKQYYLVVNCGACMLTRNSMMNKIDVIKDHKIFATNYGLFLAWVNGLFPRVLEPFPVEYEKYTNGQ